ncbi:MAG: 2-amino-4-hydroxy-6-hydroxymethyldihydropteridine diphosphokinase, partial [Bacteroidales bacterium]|nr:2-amino-4-hydroxy-6-hydroxymethyldihydropteridine diphosphokinase [Bacteroidales bacterium]
MTDLYLSLGSNIGNRRENLLQAIASLDERLGCRHHSLSGIIETDAWNFEGEKFLNCAVLYKINLPDNPVEQAAEDILR